MMYILVACVITSIIVAIHYRGKYKKAKYTNKIISKSIIGASKGFNEAVTILLKYRTGEDFNELIENASENVQLMYAMKRADYIIENEPKLRWNIEPEQESV